MSSALAAAAVIAVASGFAINKLTELNASYALGDNGCVPHAILGENKNLNFVCDTNTYTVGQTYTDNLGTTTITQVYDVPENVTSEYNKPGWTGTYGSNPDYREDITTANFDATFINFHPTSTAYWFYLDGYITNMTNISNLDVSSVTNMRYMFYAAGYNATTWSIGDLSNWDTSSVTDMGYMFYAAGYNATTWSIGDLSNWDTSSVTDMGGMFDSAGYSVENFDISYISNWDTSSVTNMYSMFGSTGHNATTFSLDLSNWDTSSVTDMQHMFSYAGRDATTFSLDLSNWDTSNVTDMSGMFYFAGYTATTFELDLSNWDTSNVTYMGNMFYATGCNATTFELDLSNWNTSNVTNMESMFGGSNVSSIIVGSGWNTDNVTESSYMFSISTNLVGGNGTAYSSSNPKDKTYAIIDNDNQAGYLTGTVYTVTLDNQSATTSGTEQIYEQYNTRYYLDSEKTNAMTTSANPITTPARLLKVSYNMNDTGIAPIDPTELDNYTFEGYYTETNGNGNQYIDKNGYLTNSAVIDYFKNDEGKLYAKWNSTIASLTLPDLSKLGYTCKWARDNTEGTKYEPNATADDITDDTTFFAVCTPNTYIVTFNANNGTGGPTSATATYDSDMPAITNTPTRSGYVFLGWYDNIDYTKGTKYYNDDNTSAHKWDKANNTTLYAGWIKLNTRVLEYNANGGTNAPASQTCESTTSSCNITITDKEPTRTNYTFIGWATSSTATTVTYSAGMTITVSQTATTLYAVWQDAGTGGTTWKQGQVYTHGDNKDAVLSIDYQLANFISFTVDNKTLKTDDYTIASGSTVITLKSNYLETLTNGEHTIDAKFNLNGTEKHINATFTVQDKAPEPTPTPTPDDPTNPEKKQDGDIAVPNTGANVTNDEGNAAMPIIIAVVAGVAGFIVYLWRTRFFHKKVDFEKRI